MLQYKRTPLAQASYNYLAKKKKKWRWWRFKAMPFELSGHEGQPQGSQVAA